MYAVEVHDTDDQSILAPHYFGNFEKARGFLADCVTEAIAAEVESEVPDTEVIEELTKLHAFVMQQTHPFEQQVANIYTLRKV